MAQFELSAAEAKLLSELLNSSLTELHTEINHTDSRELREELKEREEKIREILERIKSLAKP
jgi:ubiquitin C-terminal hydrolase